MRRVRGEGGGGGGGISPTRWKGTPVSKSGAQLGQQVREETVEMFGKWIRGIS